LIFPFGGGSNVIIHLPPVSPKKDLVTGKAFVPSVENRGHLFIFIR
jgi:hypothetical protein